MEFVIGLTFPSSTQGIVDGNTHWTEEEASHTKRDDKWAATEFIPFTCPPSPPNLAIA